MSEDLHIYYDDELHGNLTSDQLLQFPKRDGRYIATFTRLADRLGVQPLQENESRFLIVTLDEPDGRSFDVFEILNAFLDRLEQSDD